MRIISDSVATLKISANAAVYLFKYLNHLNRSYPMRQEKHMKSETVFILD